MDAPEEVLAGWRQRAPVVAIAAVYRRNPLAFVALASSGIEQPADSLGHTNAVEGSDGELQLAALMSKLDVDIDQVVLVPYSYDYAPFYAGEVDITASYSTGGLIRMRQAARQINLIWPDDTDSICPVRASLPANK